MHAVNNATVILILLAIDSYSYCISYCMKYIILLHGTAHCVKLSGYMYAYTAACVHTHSYIRQFNSSLIIGEELMHSITIIMVQ